MDSFGVYEFFEMICLFGCVFFFGKSVRFFWGVGKGVDSICDLIMIGIIFFKIIDVVNVFVLLLKFYKKDFIFFW